MQLSALYSLIQYASPGLIWNTHITSTNLSEKCRIGERPFTSYRGTEHCLRNYIFTLTLYPIFYIRVSNNHPK